MKEDNTNITILKNTGSLMSNERQREEMGRIDGIGLCRPDLDGSQRVERVEAMTGGGNWQFYRPKRD